MAAHVAQSIQAAFRHQSLLLDKEATKLLVQYVEEHGTLSVLNDILDALDTDSLDDSKVTRRVVEEAFASLAGDVQRDVQLVQVVSAFDVPRVGYDPIRKCFYTSKEAAQLHADAKAKVQMYWHRLYLLQQQLRRNRMFARPALAGMADGANSYVELTDIKSLLGSCGERKYIMGFLSQRQTGRYGGHTLEDLTGSVPVDLSQALTASGLITENSIVVAEGELQDVDATGQGDGGSFKVAALGFPPSEKREDAIAALKGNDTFGGTPLRADEWVHAANVETDNKEARLVVLSDVWLDRPETMEKLDTIFSGFEQLEERPFMFVLCGNFQSYDCCLTGGGGSSSGHYEAVKDNFAQLATLLDKYEYLKEESQLVFVPGQGDAGSFGLLPQPPLPAPLVEPLAQRLPNAVFGTNPCRIRYCTQEVVVFRYNLQLRMLHECVLPPDGDVKNPDAMFECLCMTLLQQAHLCPLPLYRQPVTWQFDHALGLYPMPDALILADTQPQAHYKFDSCTCLNPGSLADGTFGVYVPSKREAELSALPDAE